MRHQGSEIRTYSVSPRNKEPLLRFMIDGLHTSGCRILFTSPATQAPFRITFETPSGERMGIIAYAFFANAKPTRNRPSDEHRFQVKYGSKDGEMHEIWHDPYGLYTTIFLGIDPEMGIFVGADPVLHNPTRMFISIEFKHSHVQEILRKNWTAWERDRRADDGPVEILVGGRIESFLRYIQFERAAFGEDQGHRHLLAEPPKELPTASLAGAKGPSHPPPTRRLHSLASEFRLSPNEVLDLIEGTPRLKMAVRGWVAEEHLLRHLSKIRDVTECQRLTKEGSADVSLRFKGTPLTIECKNVLRETTRAGLARVDMQRTRASKKDPCSRYYSATDFNLIAACLHAVTLRWEFRYAATLQLDPHDRCIGKLSHRVRVDDRWHNDAYYALEQAAAFPA